MDYLPTRGVAKEMSHHCEKSEEDILVSDAIAAKQLGYDKLRDLQKNVIASYIAAFVSGKDVFANWLWKKSLLCMSATLSYWIISYQVQKTSKSIVIVATQ